MSRRESHKRASTSPTEPDLFGPAAQPDLFGDAPVARKAYVPDPRHVRNRLEDLLAQMQAAETWPWNPSIVRLHCDKTFTYLCNLLPDKEEAAVWRERLAVESARLGAADAA
ncbi:MAG: hypothetical protein ABSE69_20040 [Roseiarcus sp.]|jgi:hypothetical protein